MCTCYLDMLAAEFEKSSMTRFELLAHVHVTGREMQQSVYEPANASLCHTHVHGLRSCREHTLFVMSRVRILTEGQNQAWSVAAWV